MFNAAFNLGRKADKHENPSDEFHPVLGFDGEASDTLDSFIRQMRGYGVTLTLENGDEVEAVLSRPVYNEDDDRLEIEFFLVTDGEDYPAIEFVDQKDLQTAFVRRIQVA